jgi:NAD(P)-dependent dehydrogenase (short-subunit alcohol dehydrogenase family)
VHLKGKIALVTGGGRGIGRGIVERFLEEGAQVAVVQRQSLDNALESHPQVVHVRADLSASSSIATAVERATERLGGIDILVNNAGIMFERTISEILPEEWDLMMAINLRAPLFLAQAALPHMRERGGGSIINIGSIEGIGANPGGLFIRREEE